MATAVRQQQRLTVLLWLSAWGRRNLSPLLGRTSFGEFNQWGGKDRWNRWLFYTQGLPIMATMLSWLCRGQALRLVLAIG